MARTPEQFSVSDDSGNGPIFILDDVNGSAPGVVREISLAPGWLPDEDRIGQSFPPLGAEQMVHYGRGGRMVSFEIIVMRTFATLADAVAFKAAHAKTIPSLGVITLRYSFGAIQLESTGYIKPVRCTLANGVRVIFSYTWHGTGLDAPPVQ